jgi:hypothetical protein
MRRDLSIVSAVMMVGMSGAAVAHHGWGSYDASKMMTVETAITRLEWQNPHVHIAVNRDDGAWDVVLAPPFRMGARGLSSEVLRAGTRVRIEGYPSTRVEREMRAERITVADKTYELR